MRDTIVATLAMAALLPTASTAQMRTVSMSRQLEDEDEVRVSVEYGAGQFSVRSMDTGLLYRMSLEYDEDRYEPVAEYEDHTLEVGIESIRTIGRRHWDGGRLDLELARGVPMDLDLEFGAVQADVDLGGLALTGLDLSTGASESTIDVSEPNSAVMETARFEVGAAEFTARGLGNLRASRVEVDAGVGSLTLWLDGDWSRDARVAIDMGLGSLELRVPEGLGLELRKDSFFTSIDTEGLVKRGDVYQSLDWNDATRRVTVDLDAAFGSVKVVWIR
ncbi:MAG: toast rack family protein [Gemmatimonadales bacterium]